MEAAKLIGPGAAKVIAQGAAKLIAAASSRGVSSVSVGAAKLIGGNGPRVGVRVGGNVVGGGQTDRCWGRPN